MIILATFEYRQPSNPSRPYDHSEVEHIKYFILFFPTWLHFKTEFLKSAVNPFVCSGFVLYCVGVKHISHVAISINTSTFELDILNYLWLLYFAPH